MNQNQQSMNFSMEQIMTLAATPAGQRLLTLLQEKDGSELSRAQAMAAAGDMSKAKDALSNLLKDPQIQSLLKQLGG